MKCGLALPSQLRKLADISCNLQPFHLRRLGSKKATPQTYSRNFESIQIFLFMTLKGPGQKDLTKVVRMRGLSYITISLTLSPRRRLFIPFKRILRTRMHKIRSFKVKVTSFSVKALVNFELAGTVMQPNPLESHSLHDTMTRRAGNTF